ncbi:N-acetylmuramoyl-L-alanine amidase [Prescottella equi]|uniref:N-acetylmuramoyl-L-alanine amidase LytC n=1 Tax=Rhodococcus hoagii (strain 103S) TaxID=685727 RepID=A0A3S5Y1C2_RHOH1|nr:N-acetylmuramoyl-L-alanine amidase [Prescottella equi]MBM4483357.1 cold-shock protein [Prescottella equi]MBM4556587.1 cold-shock protein [Prescottella equi]MBM9839091.1 N-acetylmuramoyl-L-alanine amidase [Prescottella equi]MDP8017578.1 N-acetylmuramoyl-L-alanine amidase [Prescottella equi]NKS40934.1 cold-shock protein [Prescottella equi]
MPHRRPKNSIVLAAVAAVAVATPFAVQALNSEPSDVLSASDSAPTIETQIAEVVLASVPDIVIPLKELTGLDLPDLRLGDLPLPHEIPLPGGGTLTLPSLTPLAPPTAPSTAPGDIAAPAPGEVSPETLGATVKEVTQDTPFSMVGVTAADLQSSVTQLRAKLADGSWGEWITPDLIDGSSNGKQGTEPVFVGDTNAVQILVTPKDGAAGAAGTAEAPAVTDPTDPALRAPGAAEAPEAPAAEAPAPQEESDATQPLGYTPAAVSKPLRQATLTANDVAAVLINPGSGPQDANLADIATPTSVNGVNIISRKAWGANEGIRCQNPTYDDSTGGATVHHTAETNNYTREQSAGIVRGIYAYHAQSLGWCDIGYNVLVDRFGQIFEGRFGGLDRPVQGAHAGGFNENTVGIAMMGNFVNEPAPAATIESVGKYLGWRLKLANLNPKGQVTMYSEGTQYSKYPLGQRVVLPTIFAHRDVGYTECPGSAAYAQMDQIRNIAAANYGGNTGGGGSTPPTNPSNGGGNNGGANPVGSLDLNAQIPAVVNGILSIADSNPIARQWLAMGGNRSMVGDAITGLLTTATGQLYAFFQNGGIFTSPLGGVVTMIGKIFEQWTAAGGVMSDIGLPISDEYSVDGGKRSDFERGSMIFDEVTGQVTTIMNDAAAPAAAPAPAPADAVSEAPVAIN